MKDKLFDIPKYLDGEWVGMPEYQVEAVKPIKTIKINFRNKGDIEKFGELINQKIGNYENYWFPKLKIKTNTGKLYYDSPLS